MNVTILQRNWISVGTIWKEHEKMFQFIAKSLRSLSLPNSMTLSVYNVQYTQYK